MPTPNEHDPSVAESITTTAEAATQGDLHGGSRKRALTAAFLAGLAALAFVAAIVVSKAAYPLHSGDHDEPVYVFQAQMLLEGHATLSAAEQERFFKPWLSGRRGDRLVLAFTAGWPAALAVTELLFGNMRLALGLSAAAASVLCFLFARELLGEQRRAVVAAALFTVSPFFLSLSGTYLNYVFTLALELGFGFCLLRGIRTGSRPSLVVGGLLVGLAFLSRPYDAVLFSIPLVAYLFATRRRKLAQLIRELGWVVLGAAPIVAIALAYNTIVTGAPLRFPTTVQSGSRSRFGFGPRSLAVDEHAVRYTVGKALDSLWKNLVGVPTWVFGTFLTLALAVYGTIRLWRRDRATSWLLIGALVVFPVGYVFWWASKLTVSGSTNGLGPHYYLPVLPPLAILAACGAVAIWERRRSLAIATGIAAIVFTAVALPPKLADRRSVTDDHRSVKRVVDQRAPGQALIFDATSKYIMSPYPYLANKPDLTGAVLYAVDRGSADFQLLDRYPTRRPYRLIRRLNPGDILSKRALVLKPVSTAQAAKLNVTVQVRNPSGHPFVIVYLRDRGGVERRVIDTNSTKNNVYRFTWTLSPNDVAFDGPPSELLSQMPPLERSGTLTIGVAFANDRSPRDPDRNERRYPYRLHTSQSGSTIEIISADSELVRFGAPISKWLPVSVAHALDVKWSSQGTTSPAPPPPSTGSSGG